MAVHLLWLSIAVVGDAITVAASLHHGAMGLSTTVTVYALGFIAMLAFSTAYNFAKPQWQLLLYRIDHAGILLMIAASYTPLTTQVLHGAWSWVMTSIVRSLAAGGIDIRLFMPRPSELVSTVFYLAIGWVMVIAIKPLVQETPLLPLILLAAGGSSIPLTPFFLPQNLSGFVPRSGTVTCLQGRCRTLRRSCSAWS